MKEAVEEAFAAGLVKVVFATETLSLGINMPARSVVIEKLSKFTGEHHEFLTPGEYTQLTGPGRAPRHRRRRLRGRAAGTRSCRSTRSPALASRRTYALHVVVPPDVQHGGQPRAAVPAASRRTTSSNLSFAQFHADRDVVALERQLERDAASSSAQAEAAAVHPSGRRRRSTGALLAELDAARRAAHGRGPDGRLDTLRPGDVVIVRRSAAARSSC